LRAYGRKISRRAHQSRVDWAVQPKCGVCGRPQAICVCDRVQKMATRLRVVILQHPQEQGTELSSTPLVLANLIAAQRVVGLSWPSLAAAIGEKVEGLQWAVAFPINREMVPIRLSKSNPFVVLDRHQQVLESKQLRGVVVLDGTWSQAKTLWWRNSWLLKLPRLGLFPAEPSIYGSLRPEPRRHYVSTLESIAAALDACGEPPEVGAHLRRVFRTMVQRVRDFAKERQLAV
jgi:DTW domain-containing protein